MKCKVMQANNKKGYYIKKYWPGRGYIIPISWNEFKITNRYKILLFCTEEEAKKFIIEKGWTKLEGWTN